MTNEFARDILQQLKDNPSMVNDIDIVEEACWLTEALEMGIKALDQQPCEDAISRAEVRQLICKNNDKYGYSDRFHEFTEECLNLPSVTPARPHGQWEVVDRVKSKCDNCGATFAILSPDKDSEANFCPNCGADMREVKADE